jgi:predicted DNA-binding transcriptional regulator AlpA
VNETYLAPEPFERIAQGIERLIEVLVPKTSELVGTEYVASKLGVSKQWVGKMAEKGTIPKNCIAPKVSGGRIWKFYRDKTDAWLKEKR